MPPEPRDASASTGREPANSTGTACIGVLGAGNVGSALVRAFLARGHAVTAWNRSPARLEPLAAAGVLTAGDAAAAVAGAPIIFIALSDYRAFDTLLDEVEEAHLGGRLFVQLSSGSPDEAEALGTKLRACGGRYLTGLLVSYPCALLDGSAIMFFSGAEGDFNILADRVLREAGWNVAFAGERPGRARQISNLFEAACTNAIVGYLLGAALADALDIPVRQYAELIVPRLLPTLEQIFARYTAQIEAGEYTGEMSIELWRHGVRRQIQDAERLGVDPASLRVVEAQMGRCVTAGLGACDITALFEAIRNGAAGAERRGDDHTDSRRSV